MTWLQNHLRILAGLAIVVFAPSPAWADGDLQAGQALATAQQNKTIAAGKKAESLKRVDEIKNSTFRTTQAKQKALDEAEREVGRATIADEAANKALAEANARYSAIHGGEAGEPAHNDSHGAAPSGHGSEQSDAAKRAAQQAAAQAAQQQPQQKEEQKEEKPEEPEAEDKTESKTAEEKPAEQNIENQVVQPDNSILEAIAKTNEQVRGESEDDNESGSSTGEKEKSLDQQYDALISDITNWSNEIKAESDAAIAESKKAKEEAAEETEEEAPVTKKIVTVDEAIEEQGTAAEQVGKPGATGRGIASTKPNSADKLINSLK